MICSRRHAIEQLVLLEHFSVRAGSGLPLLRAADFEERVVVVAEAVCLGGIAVDFDRVHDLVVDVTPARLADDVHEDVGVFARVDGLDVLDESLAPLFFEDGVVDQDNHLGVLAAGGGVRCMRISGGCHSSFWRSGRMKEPVSARLADGF